jgi:hypothetical protein
MIQNAPDPDIGKVKFELKFKKSKDIDRPFVVDVFYDMIRQIPTMMKFVRFEENANSVRYNICQHKSVQNKHMRFFIKYVPKGIKPFSLKITICSNCGVPIAYQLIVYPGDLNKYPKKKDIQKKLSNIKELKKELPKAVYSRELKIGV